jgi:hypothetical protein
MDAKHRQGRGTDRTTFHSKPISKIFSTGAVYKRAGELSHLCLALQSDLAVSTHSI